MSRHEDWALEVCRHIIWAAGHLRREFDRVSAADGLTAPQFGILSQLQAHGPMPLGELGKRLWVSCANVTGLVDKLVAGGYVKRSRLRKDRRVVLAELTPKGEEVLERLRPMHKQAIARFVEELDQADLSDLNDLLDKLQRSHERSETCREEAEEKKQ